MMDALFSGLPVLEKGAVWLVGAGPGDPGLLTLHAVNALRQADVIVHDALVNADCLTMAKPGAVLEFAGKRGGKPSPKQRDISLRLVELARAGHRVLRLKGGDPFVFGRGAEEALELAREGIPCEVVPGVTTAVAAPELAGIPVTHRGLSSGFLVIAGHAGETFDAALNAVRPNSITLVVMMGMAVRDVIAHRLQTHGWAADSRAALVCGAATPAEWTWTGRLQDVGSATPPDGVPGVLVVGEVVQIREALEAAIGGRKINHEEHDEHEVKKTKTL